jgi:hypothetical protein
VFAIQAGTDTVGKIDDATRGRVLGGCETRVSPVRPVPRGCSSPYGRAFGEP